MQSSKQPSYSFKTNKKKKKFKTFEGNKYINY